MYHSDNFIHSESKFGIITRCIAPVSIVLGAHLSTQTQDRSHTKLVATADYLLQLLHLQLPEPPSAYHRV
jgi:hypothetical protein